MKQALKSKFVKALRSGKYTQVRNTLKEEFEDGSCGYCALGVLAAETLGEEAFEPVDAAELGAVDPKRKVLTIRGHSGSCLATPPQELIDCWFDKGDVWQRIWQKNDTGLTFDEIADWVEENL